jgi:hypothetical protein
MSKAMYMNVKLDAQLVRKAKVVATVQHMTLSKYITGLVRSRVETDLAVAAMELARPAVAEELAVGGACLSRIG